MLIRCGVNYASLLLSRLFEIVTILLTFQALGTTRSHFFVLLDIFIINWQIENHKIILIKKRLFLKKS